MKKIAVITGASGGLGKALVNDFVHAGWQVVGTGRSNRPADLPAEANYKQFDASDAVASQSFWEQLKKDSADAEVCLVNNAGGYVSGSLIDTSPTDYRGQMQSCYFSAVYMTRGLTLAFARARIINIISSSALAAHKNNSAYGAAKAAEMHFFQSLQREFKPEQYRITNIYPDNIASHEPAANAIKPEDLAAFVRAQADSTASFYVTDVTMHTVAN